MIEYSYTVDMTENSNNGRAVTIAKKAADCLRGECTAARMSQEKLADIVGVQRGTVNQWINTGQMKLEKFIEVAMAVGAEPHEIIRRAEALASKEGEGR